MLLDRESVLLAMHILNVKEDYHGYDPIYRVLPRSHRKPFLDGRKTIDKVSLFEEHFYGDQFMGIFFRPTIYKLLKMASYPALILITTRLLISSYDMVVFISTNVGNFLNERSNRILFEIFTELEVIAIIWDFIKYAAISYANDFDNLWCLFALSSDPKVIADIRRNKSHLTSQFIVLTLIDAAMIIGAQFLYLSMRGWRLYLNLSTKFGLIWGHFLCPFLIYDIQILSLFMSKGFAYIGWTLQEAAERGVDLEQAQKIDAEWLSYYQSLYEHLADLTKRYNKIRSVYLNTFYLTVVPKVVTVIYDILFTKLKYKLFHFGELVLALLRIQIITFYVSHIYQSSSHLWKEIYQVSLVNNSFDMFVQANLFTKRVTREAVGLKLLGFYTITPSIGPTMITLVITYFFAIISLQFQNQHFHPKNSTL